MFHKSLFTTLVLGGSIILVGLWLLSFRYYSECAVSSTANNIRLKSSFYSATIGLNFEPHDSSECWFSGSSIPVASLHHQLRDSSSPFGVLRLGRSPSIDCGAGPGHYDYFFDMPIWLIYIATVGLAYLFGRFSINHSTRAKEKKLAELASTSNGGNAPV